MLAAGIGTASDAVLALDAGADGVVAASLHTLPQIAATVAGRCPVLLDGGIRRGADVLQRVGDVLEEAAQHHRAERDAHGDVDEDQSEAVVDQLQVSPGARSW
ncbi:alpha-hydroxy-acid oxidizing protein [Streptomyces sp. NPDC050625]|uniref:alpha-hydroxy-acid oxidizing protein n=1 Tax=Streptomyces sp. NPDC050625 TaxID=3154629 RepID=UPI003417CC6B